MKKRLKHVVISLVAITILTVNIQTTVTANGGNAGNISFTITDMKATSSPIEEENDFDVKVTYHASYTNYGCDETVWSSCGSCGGAGSTWVPGEDGSGPSEGEKPMPTPQIITCGTDGFKCRPSCDGNDYNFTKPNGASGTGVVTQKPGGGWTENWTGASIGIVAHACDCSFTKMLPSKGEGGGATDNESGGSNETCSSCNGAGGSTSTIHHDPVEPPSSISAPATISLDGNLLQGQTVVFELITTQHDSYVWTKDGDTTIKWMINAGENIGKKDVETIINGGSGNNEYVDGDEETITVDVLPACNIKIEFIQPNSPYRTGTEVISTYKVSNHNSELGLNIRPKHQLTADFMAKDSRGNVLATKRVKDIVIPKGKSNIVYFKWRVPESPEGEAYLECKINTGYVKNSYGVNEDFYNDNVAVSTNGVQNIGVQETPDTQFEERVPSWFTKPNPSDSVQTNRFTSAVIDTTSFQQWEWVDNWYKLGEYNVGLQAENKLTPDEKSPSHKLVGTVFQMKSGYGISTKVNTTTTGNAPSTSITIPQSANIHFPEYRYSSQDNKFRTLQRMSSNLFEFKANPFAKNDKGMAENRRVHFTPLFYPDGEYKAQAYVYDLWTPSGMLSKTASDTVKISGNMYDDWVVTHSQKK